MVVDVDASTIIAARGNFHEVQIKGKGLYDTHMTSGFSPL
jgi:hypothetical protein